MRISPGDLISVGSSTFHGQSSSKEADTSFKPTCRSKQTDWPTIVLESGYTEYLARLRSDARWWLANSAGDVKTVLLISVQEDHQTLKLEQWVLAALAEPVCGRAARASIQMTATKVKELTVAPTFVTGAPLILKFEDIFLRAPRDGEGDFIFDEKELSTWRRDVWNSMQ
ncbi:hypothetical protein BDZ91DRAFT_661202 [Kalaharituber pfeilii]|nr:hypothetical protein BDZ91DRAFT_661202 [Kalaharituber pfeilii]